MLKELNPIIHSQLRLSIMTLLLSVEEADFTWRAGNISVQIDKLSEAGYIEVRKEFVGRKTHTSCRITERGRKAMEEYVSDLREYLKF